MKTLCTLMLCSLLPVSAALAQDAERSSFNKGWKFSKAEKVETEQDSLLSYSHAKPYILPTGNAFLSFKSPHAQPSKPFYNGQPVAKISDTPGKGMCEDETYLAYLRQVFGLDPGAPVGSSKP